MPVAGAIIAAPGWFIDSVSVGKVSVLSANTAVSPAFGMALAVDCARVGSTAGPAQWSKA